MKIVFVAPKFHNIWEPLGIGYIVSYCRYTTGIDPYFVDLNFEREWYLYTLSIDADVVAFSCTTPTYKRSLEIAREVRRYSKARIIFGGFHVSATKEVESPVDQIVVGEGEEGFISALNSTESIVYGKRLSFNELYWPDRNLTQADRLVDKCEQMCGERIASIQSVRGCKMHCKMCAEYCVSGIYNKVTNPLRIRDPEDTLDEMEMLEKVYEVSRIKFVDPTITASEEVVRNFCEAKIRRNNTIKWNAMVHAGLCTRDSLKYMKEAGCDIIAVGCESGNPAILRDIRKGSTVEDIKNVFKWGKEIGLNRRAFFMIGFPDESIETINDTRDLIRAISPDILGFTILTPYFGSHFYRTEFATVNWENADEYNNDFWYTEYFTNEELNQIQKDLNHEFKDILVEHQRSK